jgi:hypothetical protein
MSSPAVADGLVVYDVTELRSLVASLRYRPGWTFCLQGGAATTTGEAGQVLMLVVEASLLDATDDYGGMTFFRHPFAVPPVQWDRARWTRWLIDVIHLIEIHEMCEWFKVGDERPFRPQHGPDPDANLYEIRYKAS